MQIQWDSYVCYRTEFCAAHPPLLSSQLFLDVAVIPYKSNIKEKKPMKNLLMLTIALMLPAFAAHAETSKKGDLNDAEIAHIVVTANQVDIDAGNLAKKKHLMKMSMPTPIVWLASTPTSIRKRRNWLPSSM